MLVPSRLVPPSALTYIPLTDDPLAGAEYPWMLRKAALTDSTVVRLRTSQSPTDAKQKSIIDRLKSRQHNIVDIASPASSHRSKRDQQPLNTIITLEVWAYFSRVLHDAIKAAAAAA